MMECGILLERGVMEEFFALMELLNFIATIIEIVLSGRKDSSRKD